jgi:hypothetical protein
MAAEIRLSVRQPGRRTRGRLRILTALPALREHRRGCDRQSRHDDGRHEH